MGHAGGVLDEGIHVAQADRQGGELDLVHHLLAGFKSAFQLEGDHAAEIEHLALGQLVIGVAFQAGIEDFSHGGVGFEEARHLHGVGAVALHAQLEGLQPDAGQPGIEGAGAAAQVLEDGIELGLDVGNVAADDRAAHDQAVTAEVLGGGMDDHVRAEGERALAVGRGEGVIHHQPGALFVGDIRDGLEIGERHGGVGGGFGIGDDGLGIIFEGLLPVLDGGILEEDGLDAVAGSHVLQEDVGGAVERLLGDDGIPGFDLRQDGRGDGGHAGGEDQSSNDLPGIAIGLLAEQVQSFEGGDLERQLIQVGVPYAGVDVTILRALEGARSGSHIGE